MALHNLVITVVDGGSTNSNTFLGESINQTQDRISNKKNVKENVLYKVLNYNQILKNNMSNNLSPTTFFAIESGMQLAKQTIRQVANYYISDIGRSNGDSNFQAQVNRTIEIIQDVGNFASGTISGAAVGSAAGPFGVIVGAVVGLVSSAVSTGFKYAEREREYQHEKFKENTNQAYNLARANYSAFTGRVR